MQADLRLRPASKGSSNVDISAPLPIAPDEPEMESTGRLAGCHRPAAPKPPDGEKTCRFYAAFSVTPAASGSPSSIGSAGSRDHSFQEPKYIRTSFTPAFLSARNVFEARAPLKQ